MPALAESATFQTKSHARVADGRIQLAQGLYVDGMMMPVQVTTVNKTFLKDIFTRK